MRSRRVAGRASGSGRNISGSASAFLTARKASHLHPSGSAQQYEELVDADSPAQSADEPNR